MTDDWAKSVYQKLHRRSLCGSAHASRSCRRFNVLARGPGVGFAEALDQMVAEGDQYLIQIISDMVAARLQGKT